MCVYIGDSTKTDPKRDTLKLLSTIMGKIASKGCKAMDLDSQTRKIEEMRRAAVMCAEVRGAGAEYVLIPVSGPFKAEDVRASLAIASARGYRVCGYFGIYLDGKVQALTQPDADDLVIASNGVTMANAALSFARFVHARNTQVKSGHA